MRALITGASGLAGGWLCRECVAAGDEVLGVSRSGTVPAGVCEGEALDLADASAVALSIARFEPEVVYHLAALSSVGRSWEEPGQTLSANLGRRREPAVGNPLRGARSACDLGQLV